MAFRFEPGESIDRGIERTVRHELERALTAVADVRATMPSAGQDTSSEAVHDIRKRFKRVRAALRLVRPAVGDDVYRELNYRLRDAARPLAQLRDAQMLVATFDALASQLGGRVPSETRTKVRDGLVANERSACRAVLGDASVLAATTRAATHVLARIPELSVGTEGWSVVERGVRRVYRVAHRALARATEQPSVANLHEWRKQTKYLWHQLELLEPSWKRAWPRLGDRMHELSTQLGDDHDLAVFEQILRGDPLSYGGQRALKALMELVEGRRRTLQQQAFALGEQLYKHSPKEFVGPVLHADMAAAAS